MAGTRGTNTFAEGLRKILQDISELKITPDADLDFAIELESMVLTKIREPQDQLAAIKAGQAGGGSSMAPMDPMMSADPMMGGAGAMGAMGGMGAPPMDPAAFPVGPMGPSPVPGVGSMPSLPPADEMARLLGG